jgi:Tfp pilus assembly protein PilX
LTAGASNTALLSKQPEYIFEDLGELLPPNTVHNGQAGAIGRDPFGCKDAGCQSMHSYRITSRSTGGNDASVRAVEVYFGAVAPSN